MLRALVAKLKDILVMFCRKDSEYILKYGNENPDYLPVYWNDN